MLHVLRRARWRYGRTRRSRVFPRLHGSAVRRGRPKERYGGRRSNCITVTKVARVGARWDHLVKAIGADGRSSKDRRRTLATGCGALTCRRHLTQCNPS